MRKKERAVEGIVYLLRTYLCTHPDVAKDLAEKIFSEIVEPAVEEERNEWIILAKAAPAQPDGRGWDS